MVLAYHNSNSRLVLYYQTWNCWRILILLRLVRGERYCLEDKKQEVCGQDIPLICAVSLARAVYSNAATLILDDVISAVDAETSKHIITHCFQSSLMINRTVIIASHAVEALAPLADKAIFLDQGTVMWQGTGPELLTSSHMPHLQSEKRNHDQMPEQGPRDTLINSAEVLPSDGTTQFDIKEAPLKTPRQLVKDEHQLKGAVKMHYWYDFFRTVGSWPFWMTAITLIMFSSVVPVLQRAVLRWELGGSIHC